MDESKLDDADLFIKRLVLRLKYPPGAEKSRDWLMDADEMFAVRRGVSG